MLDHFFNIFLAIIWSSISLLPQFLYSKFAYRYKFSHVVCRLSFTFRWPKILHENPVSFFFKHPIHCKTLCKVVIWIDRLYGRLNGDYWSVQLIIGLIWNGHQPKNVNHLNIGSGWLEMKKAPPNTKSPQNRNKKSK